MDPVLTFTKTELNKDHTWTLGIKLSSGEAMEFSGFTPENPAELDAWYEANKTNMLEGTSNFSDGAYVGTAPAFVRAGAEPVAALPEAKPKAKRGRKPKADKAAKTTKAKSKK